MKQIFLSYPGSWVRQATRSLFRKIVFHYGMRCSISIHYINVNSTALNTCKHLFVLRHPRVRFKSYSTRTNLVQCDLNLTLGCHRFYYLAPLLVLDPIFLTFELMPLCNLLLFCFVDVKDSNSRWEIIMPSIIIAILIVPACFGVHNCVVYIKGNYPY